MFRNGRVWKERLPMYEGCKRRDSRNDNRYVFALGCLLFSFFLAFTGRLVNIGIRFFLLNVFFINMLFVGFTINRLAIMKFATIIDYYGFEFLNYEIDKR